MMRLFGVILLVWCASWNVFGAVDEKVLSQARQFYDQKSYAKAYEVYAKLFKDALQDKLLSEDEKLRLQFYMIDSHWRSGASTSQPNFTELTQIFAGLQKLSQTVDKKNTLWPEIQESMGDFHWIPLHHRNRSQAQVYYEAALAWWGRSSDIELGRKHYIQIVRKMVLFCDQEESLYSYGNYGIISSPIAENFFKIAQSSEDRALASYVRAYALAQNRTSAQHAEILEAFETALELNASSKWLDSVLYQYGYFLYQSGLLVENENGETRMEPDHVKALTVFKRLIKAFPGQQSRYSESAKNFVNEIEEPSLQVTVSNAFLPDSEIQYHLEWKNLLDLQCSLYEVDLSRDIHFKTGKNSEWAKSISLDQAKKVTSWQIPPVTASKPHQRNRQTLKLSQKLPIGAYLLKVQSGKNESQTLILVSDLSLTIKNSRDQILAYVCDALTGSPVPHANVKLWQSDSEAKNWQSMEQKTGTSGLNVFKKQSTSHNLRACAQIDKRQALLTDYSYYGASSSRPWKIFVTTDRPAYRPGETVQWKMMARDMEEKGISTPSGETVSYTINDPRGATVKQGECKLNEFGSYWESLSLTDTMPLGLYTISFTRPAHESLSSTYFFRLEEYKLPEFKVTVQTPQQEGRPKIFLLGEKVDADIFVEYYSGGPVAHEKVDVVVYKNPIYRIFPMCDIVERGSSFPYGERQIILQQKVQIDAKGHATISFPTTRGENQDLEYTIEACVTDSSRRQVVASGTVRVTQQSYSVTLKPEGYIHAPKDKISLNCKAEDANNTPKEVEATVTITRETWQEIWISPENKEIQGEALEKIRRESICFPPIPTPGKQNWIPKKQEYTSEQILAQKIKTNAKGEAEIQFTPDKEGYYVIHWSSSDIKGSPVKTEASLWVAHDASRFLGYHSQGIEIIVDKDAFKLGTKVPILITTDVSNRYVLFTAEGNSLWNHQLVHVEGTSRLIYLDVEEKHVPNIYLDALTIFRGKQYQASKQVSVLAPENKLEVQLTSNQQEYRPGQEGSFTLNAKNAEGKGVVGEFSFSLADEAVFYIQDNLNQEPAAIFRKQEQYKLTQISSSLQQMVYARLIEQDGKLIDLQQPPIDEVRLSRRGFKNEMPMPEAAPCGASATPLRDGDAREIAARPAPIIMKTKSSDSAASAAPAIQVRTDFRPTACWIPDVKTDADGKVVVKVKYPDSTTSWQATVHGATRENQFGSTHVSTKTTQPLIARLEMPRFLIVGDEAIISGVIQNNSDAVLNTTVALTASGVERNKSSSETQKVSIPPHDQKRIDWQVQATQKGKASFKLTAGAGKESDGMELSCPVEEYGIEQQFTQARKIDQETTEWKFTLPLQRKKKSEIVQLRITPSLAMTMLDALPYLIEYPYGCTEQTMSRFLPAVIVANTLHAQGISLDEVENRIFGGIENKKQPEKKNSLNDVVSQGLTRLYDMEKTDGGWGWWKEGESDPYMTAYVVWGLTLAQQSGKEVRGDVLEKGRSWLAQHLLRNEKSPNLQAWMLHALAGLQSAGSKPTKIEQTTLESLWEKRETLNAYGRALFALALHEYGEKDKAKILSENLENGLKKEAAENGTLSIAHWGNDSISYHWIDNAVEGTAFGLKAWATIDPQNKNIEPIVHWLVNNRRGAQWNNTRDTAFTLLALNTYLQTTQELKQEVSYECSVNGHSVTNVTLPSNRILDTPTRIDVPQEYLKDGENVLQIRKKSAGPLYAALTIHYFTTEEKIPAAGHEINIKRQYFRKFSRPTLLSGFVEERVPLKDGEPLASGDGITVVLTVESRNDYEYLMFEDLKPAGFEALQVRSGEPIYARELKSKKNAFTLQKSLMLQKIRRFTGAVSPPVDNDESSPYAGRTRWVHQELRDEKTAFFIDKLSEGRWEISYDLRAEAPGTFHALPALGQAMYVPEIRTNSENQIILIQDKP